MAGRDTRRPGRTMVVVATALTVSAILAAGLVGLTPAGAAAPAKDGWWNETNVGLGFSVTPPQVPSGGLYVQNGFNGPTAVSALVVDVPAGDTVGQLTLTVAGHPVITSPPVACPLTPAGLGFKPAQGGPWTDRPAYNCTTAEVKGTVSSGNTTVSFPAARLVQGGTVAVAVLAGGPADQIAFDRPGPATLALTGPGSPPVENPPPAPVPAPVGSTPVPSNPVPASPAGQVSSGTGAVPPPSAAPSILPSPAPITGPTGGGTGGGTPASAAAPAISPLASAAPAKVATGAIPSAEPARSGSSSGGRVGGILGMIGLVGLLVAYTEGYGILGGRIRGAGRRQAARSRPA